MPNAVFTRARIRRNKEKTEKKKKGIPKIETEKKMIEATKRNQITKAITIAAGDKHLEHRL